MISRGHFPAGPVVKTLPSSVGGDCSIPGWETKIPNTSRPKNHNVNNRCNIVTNSIKTLKMVQTKKSLKKVK